MASSSASPSNFVSGFNSLAAVPPASLPVDSDMVIILAALLCAMICCVGLFAAVRCACLRRAASVSIGRSMPKVPSDKGLKKKVLESLPKSTFTNNNNSCSGSTTSSSSSSSSDDGNLAECAICLTEFVEGDELRILPYCGHGFHVACIDMWLGSHSSCPSCRQNLAVSRCNKCGELPATNSTGDIDLEMGGGFKAAEATAATTTNQVDDDDNRFLA